MVDPKIRNTPLNGDILLYFNHEINSKFSAIAYAFPCESDLFSFRTIVGQVVFNWSYMKNFSKWSIEEHFLTMVHEMHHVLGFSEQFFYKQIVKIGDKKLFMDDFFVAGTNLKSSKYSQTKNLPQRNLKFPNLLKFTQEYFNCTDLQSVPLYYNPS